MVILKFDILKLGFFTFRSDWQIHKIVGRNLLEAFKKGDWKKQMFLGLIIKNTTFQSITSKHFYFVTPLLLYIIVFINYVWICFQEKFTQNTPNLGKTLILQLSKTIFQYKMTFVYHKPLIRTFNTSFLTTQKPLWIHGTRKQIQKVI